MSDHPFRPAELHPLCPRCRKLTDSTCAICGRPYCREHLDFGWRCPSCAPRVVSGYRQATLLLVGGVVLLVGVLPLAALLLHC